MKKKLRHDYAHLSVKEFRDQYGFTQQELCSILEIGREQLAMAEAVLRPFPPNIGRQFINLKATLEGSLQSPVSRDWALHDKESIKHFWWECDQQMLELNYQLKKATQDVSDMEMLETAQRKVIDCWDNVPENVRTTVADTYTIEKIYSRCFSKLAKCGIAARLKKQLQIKIFLARIAVLKAFIADNHPA